MPDRSASQPSGWRAAIRRWLWLDGVQRTDNSEADRGFYPGGFPIYPNRKAVGRRFLLPVVVAGIAIALVIIASRDSEASTPGTGTTSAASAAPAVAAEPLYELAFPPDWVTESVDAPLGDRPAHIVLRAHPVDGAEECRLLDLSAALPALDQLGVADPETMSRVAGDLLDRAGNGVRSYGLGYSDPWSAFTEGVDDDGASYVVYTYLGRDSWPGLEDTWMALECWSDAAFHQDWRQIGRTFAFEMPRAMSASTGPLVFGGRIKLPAVGLALEVPDDWAAVDLTDPDLATHLAAGGESGEWFATQLEHSIGESIAKRAEDGEQLALWAWSVDRGSGWPEHCEIIVEDDAGGVSAASLVEAGQEYVAGDEELAGRQAWSLSELAIGEAARFDYDWTETSGGTDFDLPLPPDLRITLTCQAYTLGDEPDIESKRDRWAAMAESLRELP